MKIKSDEAVGGFPKGTEQLAAEVRNHVHSSIVHFFGNGTVIGMVEQACIITALMSNMAKFAYLAYGAETAKKAFLGLSSAFNGCVDEHERASKEKK